MAKNTGGTTLKDVQQSMTGDFTSPSLDSSFEMAELARAEAPAAPTEKWHIFKLVKPRNGGKSIDGIDDVINPRTKKLERIYLITGANSIWSSELTELLKDKDYLERNMRSLRFEAGILRVPDWDTLALEFIKVCRHFIDNPSRRSGSKHEFFEYNPQKQQEAALKKELLEMQMAIEVNNMNEQKVRELASFFNVAFVDDLGMPKSAQGIQLELMLVAKRNPVEFEKHLNSKEVKVAYLVRKAVLSAKIDLGGTSGTVTWAAGGGYIAKLPSGAQALKYLTELALTNTDEGRQFLDQLQKIA